jgi:hypothetical protein
MKVSNVSSHQNVEFADATDPYLMCVDSTVDPTRMTRDTDDAQLENFFMRPIKIFETQWGTGTILGTDFDPWTLFWENPRVINRITNYNLLRCKLRLKVVINGNGFQYGRAMMAYQPFDIYDDLSSHATLTSVSLVETSQLPKIFLDPTTSQGGEMTLPMFYYKDYLNIPDKDWNNLGRMYLRSINTLRHANGATDTVTISVFAWAEDVSMSVLTSVEPDTLTPQSGEIDEANNNGIVSGPATAISKAASYFTNVPYISPFAMATTMAASTVGSIAKMFGYCKPVITKAPEPYKPTAISSLALTNVPEAIQKLTLDHKQELSIDPRIAGLGGADPLNLREIAKRESYLTTFNWNIGTSPETLLWNSRVSPVLWAETQSVPTGFLFPACAFAALPFQFWTGSMKFRFQIVASAYHKGRIKVVYDPNFIATNEYNTNYTKIVDISEEQDFTVEFGPGREFSIVSHAYPGIDSVTTLYGTNQFTSKEDGNGVVAIYVVNELTTPNSTVTNDIEVNVYVSMGDDSEFFIPDNHIHKFVFAPTGSGNETLIDTLEPQSGMIIPDAMETTEPSAPEQARSSIVGMQETNHPDLNKVYTGESITSFRTLLKRYNMWSCIGPTASQAIVAGRFPHFPYLRGSVVDAVDKTAIDVPYNYCNTVMLHWVRNAFSGWRGSIRYKFLQRGARNAQITTVSRARFTPGGSNFGYSVVLSRPNYTSTKQIRYSGVYSTNDKGEHTLLQHFGGMDGAAMAVEHVNPNMEFEVPWYSQRRFEPGKRQSYTGLVFTTAPWNFRTEYIGDNGVTMDIHVAAGEDFQVYFFTGLPPVYYEPLPPA